MPFLAGIIPALVGGAASAGAGALVNSVAGSNKSAPANPNIVNPVAPGQLDKAATDVSGQFQNQNALQQALMAQAGLQKQNDVYNQQQGLAGQLLAESQGQGPNPAQAALAQNTAANVAQTGALLGSQRGASANPALLARQIGQQSAATQQGAAGQAALMQAQQQLAAQQQLQQQQGMLGNLATTQAGQQIQNQQNLTSQQVGQQQALLQAQSQANATQAGMSNVQQTGQNQLNQGMFDVTGKLIGGAANSIGGALSNAIIPQKPAVAPVVNKAQGGEIENPKLRAVAKEDRFPVHVIMPPHLKDMATLYHGHSFGNPEYQQINMAQGGHVQADVGHALKTGGHVPGKAKVKGDSEKNDTVAAMLSPGEVVLPRSVMNAKDPVSAAAQFVAALQKKKGNPSSHEKDFRDALKRTIASRKVK